MFKRAAFLMLLCGMLMLTSCAKPDTQTAASSDVSSAAESTERTESAEPQPTTRVMDARWLGVKFTYPSEWLITEQNNYVDALENGIGDIESMSKIVTPDAKITLSDEDKSEIYFHLIPHTVDLGNSNEADWTDFLETAFAYDYTYYYDNERHDVLAEFPYYQVKVLDYTEKMLGENEVLRISVWAKYVMDIYANNDLYADLDDPDYLAALERLETYWFVNLPEGEGYFIEYRTTNDQFPRIPEIEKMIESMTFTKTSPFKEYFTEPFDPLSDLIP